MAPVACYKANTILMHGQQSPLAQEEGEQSLHLMQWKLLMLSRALGKVSDSKHWHASLAAPSMQLRVGMRGPPKKQHLDF